MELEWDETKRKANIAKHGVDFADIPSLDWDNATVLEDTRKDYPEPRYWAFAKRGTRLHMVAFCLRGEAAHASGEGPHRQLPQGKQEGGSALWQISERSSPSRTMTSRK